MSKKLVLKSVSGVLLAALFCQEVAYANLDLKPFLSGGPEKVKLSFSFPESVATIEDSLKVPGSDKLVYLIQDAHTNVSGQLNVAKSLDLIFRHESLKYVFLEAGEGDVSLSFLRKHSTLEERKRTAESFLRKGRLQGSEYLDLTSEHEFVLWGVEDQALYAQSVTMYAEAIGTRESFQTYLDRIYTVIQMFKPKIYNPTLVAFDETYARYRKEEISLTDYYQALNVQASKLGLFGDEYPHLKTLGKLRELEAKIDFAGANEEQKKALASMSEADRTAMGEASKQSKASKLSAQTRDVQKAYFALFEEKLATRVGEFPELSKYLSYLKETRNIDAKLLFKEVSVLEKNVFAAMARTEDERSLVAASRNIAFLKKMLNLTLTPSEYEEFRADKADFDIARLTGFLNRKIMDFASDFDRVSFLETGYEEAIARCEAFYELTYTRDERFIENLTKKMENEHQKKAILITGGYHTPNLKHLLEQKGISYVSITPQILNETNQSRYEDLLLAQKSAITKSAIAPIASPALATNMLWQMITQYKNGVPGIRAILNEFGAPSAVLVAARLASGQGPIADQVKDEVPQASFGVDQKIKDRIHELSAGARLSLFGDPEEVISDAIEAIDGEGIWTGATFALNDENLIEAKKALKNARKQMNEDGLWADANSIRKKISEAIKFLEKRKDFSAKIRALKKTFFGARLAENEVRPETTEGGSPISQAARLAHFQSILDDMDKKNWLSTTRSKSIRSQISRVKNGKTSIPARLKILKNIETQIRKALVNRLENLIAETPNSFKAYDEFADKSAKRDLITSKLEDIFSKIESFENQIEFERDETHKILGQYTVQNYPRKYFGNFSDRIKKIENRAQLNGLEEFLKRQAIHKLEEALEWAKSKELKGGVVIIPMQQYRLARDPVERGAHDVSIKDALNQPSKVTAYEVRQLIERVEEEINRRITQLATGEGARLAVELGSKHEVIKMFKPYLETALTRFVDGPKSIALMNGPRLTDVIIEIEESANKSKKYSASTDRHTKDPAYILQMISHWITENLDDDTATSYKVSIEEKPIPKNKANMVFRVTPVQMTDSEFISEDKFNQFLSSVKVRSGYRTTVRKSSIEITRSGYGVGGPEFGSLEVRDRVTIERLPSSFIKVDVSTRVHRNDEIDESYIDKGIIFKPNSIVFVRQGYSVNSITTALLPEPPLKDTGLVSEDGRVIFKISPAATRFLELVGFSIEIEHIMKFLEFVPNSTAPAPSKLEFLYSTSPRGARLAESDETFVQPIASEQGPIDNAVKGQVPQASFGARLAGKFELRINVKETENLGVDPEGTEWSLMPIAQDEESQHQFNLLVDRAGLSRLQPEVRSKARLVLVGRSGGFFTPGIIFEIPQGAGHYAYRILHLAAAPNIKPYKDHLTTLLVSQGKSISLSGGSFTFLPSTLEVTQEEQAIKMVITPTENFGARLATVNSPKQFPSEFGELKQIVDKTLLELADSGFTNFNHLQPLFEFAFTMKSGINEKIINQTVMENRDNRFDPALVRIYTDRQDGRGGNNIPKRIKILLLLEAAETGQQLAMQNPRPRKQPEIPDYRQQIADYITSSTVGPRLAEDYRKILQEMTWLQPLDRSDIEPLLDLAKTDIQAQKDFAQLADAEKRIHKGLIKQLSSLISSYPNFKSVKALSDPTAFLQRLQNAKFETILSEIKRLESDIDVEIKAVQATLAEYTAEHYDKKYFGDLNKRIKAVQSYSQLDEFRKSLKTTVIQKLKDVLESTEGASPRVLQIDPKELYYLAPEPGAWPPFSPISITEALNEASTASAYQIGLLAKVLDDKIERQMDEAAGARLADYTQMLERVPADKRDALDKLILDAKTMPKDKIIKALDAIQREFHEVFMGEIEDPNIEADLQALQPPIGPGELSAIQAYNVLLRLDEQSLKGRQESIVLYRRLIKYVSRDERAPFQELVRSLQRASTANEIAALNKRITEELKEPLQASASSLYTNGRQGHGQPYEIILRSFEVPVTFATFAGLKEFFISIDDESLFVRKELAGYSDTEKYPRSIFGNIVRRYRHVRTRKERKEIPGQLKEMARKELDRLIQLSNGTLSYDSAFEIPSRQRSGQTADKLSIWTLLAGSEMTFTVEDFGQVVLQAREQVITNSEKILGARLSMELALERLYEFDRRAARWDIDSAPYSLRTAIARENISLAMSELEALEQKIREMELAFTIYQNLREPLVETRRYLSSNNAMPISGLGEILEEEFIEQGRVASAWNSASREEISGARLASLRKILVEMDWLSIEERWRLNERIDQAVRMEDVHALIDHSNIIVTALKEHLIARLLQRTSGRSQKYDRDQLATMTAEEMVTELARVEGILKAERVDTLAQEQTTREKLLQYTPENYKRDVFGDIGDRVNSVQDRAGLDALESYLKNRALDELKKTIEAAGRVKPTPVPIAHTQKHALDPGPVGLRPHKYQHVSIQDVQSNPENVTAYQVGLLVGILQAEIRAHIKQGLGTGARLAEPVEGFFRGVAAELSGEFKGKVALALEPNNEIVVYSLAMDGTDRLLVEVSGSPYQYIVDTSTGALSEARAQDTIGIIRNDDLTQKASKLHAANRIGQGTASPVDDPAVFFVDLKSFTSRFELQNLIIQQEARMGPGSVVVFLDDDDDEVTKAVNLVSELRLKKAAQFMSLADLPDSFHGDKVPHILLTKQGQTLKTPLPFSNLLQVTLQGDENGQTPVFAFGAVQSVMSLVASGDMKGAFDRFLEGAPERYRNEMNLTDFKDFLNGKEDVIRDFPFPATVWASFRDAVRLYQLSRITDTNA